MNTRYETERDLRDLHEPMEQDREISLGTTTILGIFFALALICAVFFGFGYSLGRRSSQTVTVPSEATTGSEGSTSKPSSGITTSQTPTAKPGAGAPQSEVVSTDASSSVSEDQPSPAPTVVKAAAPTPRAEVPVDPPARMPAKATAASSSGSTVVQVAAMSHQEDADVVAADLKRRGYTVAIRREPQDKLFHVQVGSFANKKEADAMKQRLQGDGYNNAIVK